MVHLCDVCQAAEATVWSFSDHAVLCTSCDQTMQTGKGSKKRERVKLQSNEESANCDICQDAKAVLFCSEDRALICRRCDLMIHSANEFAAKHHRFLLSGVAVGFKALDNTGVPPDEGTSKRPYSLRNTGNGPTSSSGRNGDLGSLASERSSWRSPPQVDLQSRHSQGVGPKATSSRHLAQGQTLPAVKEGSQPSLIGMSSGNIFARAPSLATGASLMTPFGPGGEAGPSLRGDAGRQAAMQDVNLSNNPGSSVEASNLGWGGTSDLSRPDSTDLTLASELLGIPAVSGGFTAKDIDAAYIFDDGMDFETGFSNLLEVPSLDFTSFDDPPVVTENSQPQENGLRESARLNQRHNAVEANPSDGLVPSFQYTKRQKL